MPIINIYNNPFKLAEKTPHVFDAGCTLIECLMVLYPNGFKTKTRVKINGKELKVDNFDVILAKNDVISIYEYPKGGFALRAAGILGFGYLLYKGYQSTMDSLKSGAVVVDEPELPSSLKRNTGNAYNLREQRNLARLGEPIPTQYGKTKWFPDLAAQPWKEYISNYLFLNQLFCLGFGSFDISEIRLGDIDITGLDGVTYAVYGPNETVSQFHDNMYTIPNVGEYELYQQKKHSRSSINFDLLKSSSKVAGPADSNFNEFIEAGDTILIEYDLDFSYEGEFVVDSVSTSEIVLVDVSSWPGDLTSPATLISIYNSKYIQYISKGRTDLDYPDSITGRSLFLDYSPGYISSPVGTEAEIFYMDVEFPEGLYKIVSGNYTQQSARFNLYMFAVDNNNDLIYTTSVMTGAGMNGSGTTWRNSDTSKRWWDSSASFTFYDNGTPIDPGDIASIDYGTEGSGAHVVFTGSKTGPITVDGTYRYVQDYTQTITVYGESPTVKKVSLEFDMTDLGGDWDGPGRFIMYAGRLDGYDWNSTTIQTKSILTGIRTKLTAVNKYGPYTMLAVTLKETVAGVLDTSDTINVIATRKLHQWSGSAWTGPTTTRSIAWALADIWMATYGASRPYSKLDLDTLLTLDTLWTSRGDTFDGVFDSSITVWEALQKVARAGRAKPVFDGDTLSFVRDGALSTYTAMFNPDNILPNSFSLEYSFPDDQTPSGVKVKYYDEDDNYSPAEVESTTGLDKYKEVDFFGVVSYEQAWRESQFLEAQLLNQRLNVSFSTELAGHIPFVGDLISVQYDLPDWGQSGQVTAKSGTTITTSQPLDWTGSAPFYISFMEPDGSVSGPHTVTEGSTAYEAILDTDVTSFTFITTLANQNPTMYQFGPSTNWNKPCVITKITPQGDNETVAIDCVPYIAAIHTADTGTAPTKPSTTPSGNPIPPIVGGLELTNVPGSGSIVAVWNPLDGITSYKVQKSTDNSSWTDVSTPTSATETISATGLLYVRVASVVSATVGDYTKRSIVAT